MITFTVKESVKHGLEVWTLVVSSDAQSRSRVFLSKQAAEQFKLKLCKRFVID
jgi:hypothetical protein